MSAPNKEQRKICWNARDKYSQCLDQYAPSYLPTSGEKGPNECEKLRSEMINECPAKWVQHFDQRRGYEQYKQKMGMLPEDAKK